MSAYQERETGFCYKDALVKALVKMGFDKKEIEVHEKAQNLFGYRGDVREQKAHIIIRRKNIGRMSNDIGFEKVGNNYVARISEYDESASGKTAEKGFNKDWREGLNEHYHDIVLPPKLKAAGLGYRKHRTKEGKLQYSIYSR